MNKQKSNYTTEDRLFVAGWIILAVCVALLLLKNCIYPELVIIEKMCPCYLYTLLDFYCPGCGGSRSVAALVHGKFIVCAVNFPLVAYSVLMYLWFMISQTVQRISNNHCKVGLRWRMAYLWIALGILLAHFVLKNLFYLVTGIPPFLPLYEVVGKEAPLLVHLHHFIQSDAIHLSGCFV